MKSRGSTESMLESMDMTDSGNRNTVYGWVKHQSFHAVQKALNEHRFGESEQQVVRVKVEFEIEDTKEK